VNLRQARKCLTASDQGQRVPEERLAQAIRRMQRSLCRSLRQIRRTLAREETP
jgi:hypothetical protein